MKIILFSAGLAAVIATCFVVTSTRAEDAMASGPTVHAAKMKPVTVKRMKKDGVAGKNKSKLDYYTIEREKMMKISM